MLSDRCLSCLTICLSVLSVTLVYCGQTVGRIKMKPGVQVGLVPGHIVLHGDPGPPPAKGHSPQFSSHICCGQMARWMKMPLGRKIGLDPSDIVLDAFQLSPPQKGGIAPSNICVRCACNSPTAAALSTSFLLNLAFQRPGAQRIDYKV